MRKFLERCGLVMESVMRKHKIVDSRNRDTAVYVLLNSDWDTINVKLKKILGIDLRKKVHKVAEIEEASSRVNGNSASQNVPGITLSKSQKDRIKAKKRKDDKKTEIK